MKLKSKYFLCLVVFLIISILGLFTSFFEDVKKGFVDLNTGLKVAEWREYYQPDICYITNVSQDSNLVLVTSGSIKTGYYFVGKDSIIDYIKPVLFYDHTKEYLNRWL